MLLPTTASLSIVVSIFLDTQHPEVPGSGMSSFRKNSGATCRKSGKAGKITLGIKAGKIVVSSRSEEEHSICV